MKFIPFACIGAVASGLLGLFWYELLSASEKKRVDSLAASASWSLFQKSVDQLSTFQWATVMTHVRKMAGLEHQD